MSRRKPEFQTLDVATWPAVAYTEFDPETRRAFEARMQALIRYARGESLKQIEQCTGVNRRQLYRWLERALSPHPDGRPFGFRALVSYVRVAEYVRLSPVRISGERGSRGAAGATRRSRRGCCCRSDSVACCSNRSIPMGDCEPACEGYSRCTTNFSANVARWA